MRLAFALDDLVLETALLQEGHDVHRIQLPTHSLSRWQTARLLTDLKPDAILAPATLARLAARLGLRLVTPDLPSEYLLPRLAPLVPDPTETPTLGIAGTAENLPVPAQTLTAPWHATLTDITLLAPDAPNPETTLADWLAAGRTILAPATETTLTHEHTALLYTAETRNDLIHQLLTTPNLRHHLATNARTTFENRHADARAELRRVIGE